MTPQHDAPTPRRSRKMIRALVIVVGLIVGSCLVGLGVSMWRFSADMALYSDAGDRIDALAYRKEGRRIYPDPGKTPAGVPQNAWGNAVAWLTTAHANIHFDFRRSRELLRRFHADLDAWERTGEPPDLRLIEKMTDRLERRSDSGREYPRSNVQRGQGPVMARGAIAP